MRKLLPVALALLCLPPEGGSYGSASPLFIESAAAAGLTFTHVNGAAGQTIRLTKLLTYHDSRHAPVDELAERADRALTRARSLGFDGLAAAQEAYLCRFWDRADVEVRGNGILDADG